MTKILELSEREYSVTMINMLRAVVEKVDNMQEWVSKVSREMESLKKKIKRKCKKSKTKTRNELCLCWAHQDWTH